MYAKENFKQKISRMAVMVTATASLLLVSTVPVFGIDRPPSCLEAEQVGDNIIVKNKCGKSMRFKVVYAFAPDSRCETIGTAYTTPYPKLRGRFDGLGSC